jgi:amino acid adenylation domain-containing protein
MAAKVNASVHDPIYPDRIVTDTNCADLLSVDAPIHRLFEAQAARTPTAIALSHNHTELTYAELNQQANQWARSLQALGVEPHHCVGICVERSPLLIIGLLAILKVGAAYVPLDPSYPAERLAFMLQDAQIEVLLTQSGLESSNLSVHEPFQASIQRLYLDQPVSEDTHNLDVTVDANALMYVIYTSGSTGIPKGVAVEHGSVKRLVCRPNYIDWQPSDVVAQVSNASFDAATFEIWGALLNGAQLAIVESETALNPKALADFLSHYHVTVLFLTTVLFNQMAREVPTAFGHMRYVLFGGEAVDSRWVRAVSNRRPPAHLLHVYGPTECTTFATWYEVKSALNVGDYEAETIPIGYPISSTDCYILDEQLRCVADGEAGELYLGGTGLARGYWQRPELTAARFIDYPTVDLAETDTANAPLSGQRLYRTGDLVRRLPNGAIAYISRLDHQVKLRGFRIELGEIEARLRLHPVVQDCVVMVRNDSATLDAPNAQDKYLAAYLAVGEDVSLTVSDLRQFVQDQLPDYMVPAAFVLLERLPLTPNGKVDRKALPIPDTTRPALGAAYVAPQTVQEQQVADIWATVLQVRCVGRHDPFLELGGHSLLAAQAIAQINAAFQIHLPVTTLLTTPTLAELMPLIATAQATAGCETTPSPIPVANTAQPLPLSYAQQQMWLMTQLEPNTPYYNDAVTLTFHGTLNRAALEQSLREIIRRHSILRTRFTQVGGKPQQVIQPDSTFALRVLDLQHLSPQERERQVLRVATTQAQAKFDLQQPPLLRATLMQLTPTEFRLDLVLHHIIYDGFALYRVFWPELTALYTAYAAGLPSPLPEVPLQYADFAVWQQSLANGAVDSKVQSASDLHLEYWTHQLADLPRLLLPSDRPQPSQPSFRGAQHRFSLSPALTAELKRLSGQLGSTLFVTLMTTLKVLLHRYTGQTDIPVATVTAGRDRPDLEAMMGCFVNTLILRTDLADCATFQEAVQRVRAVSLAAAVHQQVPFQQVVEAVRQNHSLRQQSLFHVLMVLAPPLPQLQSEWSIDLQLVDAGTTECDLYLEFDDRPEGLTGRIEYSTDLFDAATIHRFVGHFQTLLDGIVAQPDTRLADLPLLTAGEQTALLAASGAFAPPATLPVLEPQFEALVVAAAPEFRAIAVNPEDCLHRLFEAQVQRCPEAIAVVFQDQTLTYAALDHRANQLAIHLQHLGVGPDVLVGLCVDRSLDLPVAILGILKAGGAYVPLDPASPPERLAGIVDDMQPILLVTQSHLVERLPAHAAQLVCLDRNLEHSLDTQFDSSLASDAPFGTAPISTVTTDHLAYVIYTSGSTGKPKGVLINHANVVRLFQSTQHWYHFNDQDVWTLFHSYAFDFSVWELWGALLYGGRLVIVPHCITRSPDAFYQLLCDEQVTVLNQTPSAFRQLIRAEELRRPDAATASLALRYVIFGGEALELNSLKPWFDRHGDHQPQLVNMYGITETTVHVTYRPVGLADLHHGARSIIGQPIPDLQLYILDAHRQLVPVGVPGELYVGGPGLARGYLNRPELTAERFIPNPFISPDGVDSESRLYRSGDLARRLPNGDIEYLGRIDNQVKIRGFRIELGEVEAVLQAHPDIRDGVAIVREDTPGDKRLAGYFTARTTLAIPELRAFLQKKLPEYMVPAALMQLEVFPLTINGKVDVRALPLPDVRPDLDSTFIAPQTPMEQQIAEIWTAILGIKEVGTQDDFFALGGNSLLAAQLIAQINHRFHVQLPVSTVFTANTIAKLAEVLPVSQVLQTPIPSIVSMVQEAKRMKLSTIKETWLPNPRKVLDVDRAIAQDTEKQASEVLNNSDV